MNILFISLTISDQEALVQARAENKLVLVAKFRSNDEATKERIFNNKHVKQLLAQHFILMEEAATKGDGPDYLVYDGTGSLVHRVIGERYPYEFIAKIRKALIPETRFDAMVARFEQGDRSAVLLEQLVEMATDAGDSEGASRFMTAYLEAQECVYAPETLRFILRHTRSSDMPSFRLLLANLAEAAAATGDDRVVEQLSTIILKEEFLSHVDVRKVDVHALVARVKVKFPQTALSAMIDRMALELLERREDWPALQEAWVNYANRYVGQLDAQTKDYYAWLLNAYAQDPLAAR